MSLTQMYPAKNNSPTTELAAPLESSGTVMTVVDASVLPAAPNLAVIGSSDNAEIVLYTVISGTTITIVRGQNGTTPGTWSAGAPVARNFTAMDHEAFRENILDLDTQKANVDDLGALASLDQLSLASESGIVTGTLPLENGGTGQTSLNDIKDAFGLWYKPGDSVGIGSGDASYAGFLALAKRARFIITLDKPVKPGTTISITGTVAVRVGTSRTDIELSNVAGTATVSGIRVDANSSTSMGSTNEPCAVGSAGFTITFS